MKQINVFILLSMVGFIKIQSAWSMPPTLPAPEGYLTCRIPSTRIPFAKAFIENIVEVYGLQQYADDSSLITRLCEYSYAAKYLSPEEIDRDVRVIIENYGHN